MLCHQCAASIGNGDALCSACGRSFPASLHGRRALLHQAWAAGTLSEADYVAAQTALIVRDAQGRAWLPEIRDGEWLLWKDSGWVPTDDAPEPSRGPAPASDPAKSSINRLLIGAAVVVALLLGGISIVALLQSGRLSPRASVPQAMPLSEISWLTFADEDDITDIRMSGGTAAISDEKLCLESRRARPVLATWKTVEGDMAVQGHLHLPAGAEGASGGVLVGSTSLFGEALLVEVNGSGAWRTQRLGRTLGVDSTVPWESSRVPRPLGDSHHLGLLREGDLVTVFINGVAMAQEPLKAGGAMVGLAAIPPEGGSESAVCYSDWRIEVWPGTGPRRPRDDRGTILSELGNPDAFSLSFDQDRDGVLYRVETWSYADAGIALTFVDGVLINDESLQTWSEELILWPVQYDPLAFEAGMTPRQVQRLIGQRDLVALEVPAELGENMVLYAGDQIILGFTEGELEYVETLAISVDTLEGEE